MTTKKRPNEAISVAKIVLDLSKSLKKFKNETALEIVLKYEDEKGL